MYPAVEPGSALAQVATQQDGVVHRDQIRTAGLSKAYVNAQLDGRRWTAVGESVVLLQNAPATRAQMMWLACLDGGPRAALGSHTALELAGFKPFAKEAADIHLLVPRGRHVTPLRGVRVHESRRLKPDDIHTGRGLPRTRVPRSAVDAGAWQPYPRFACLMMAATVQQRLTTPALLQSTLDDVGAVRHRAYMRLAVRDVRGGAQAAGELDLAAVCRRFRLCPPDRQSRRRDAKGRRRYLDAEWTLADGEVVVLEIDGAHHLDVGQWEDDIRRERAVVVSRRRVLRAANIEMRLDPAAVVADLRALGVPTVPTVPTVEVVSVRGGPSRP